MRAAVIGHGRSPEGQGWGKQIDQCPMVVRMWDWAPWQPPADYGTHYDYGLFVCTPKGVQIINEHNERIPTKAWLAYLGGKGVPSLEKQLAQRPVTFINPVPWVETAQGMGGKGLSGKLTLTRGCVAAAWAITQVGVNGEVVLVGFDNVQCGINQPIEQSFFPEYWALYMSRFKPDRVKTYPIGLAKTATHDMSIELPFLKWLAGRYMVKLSFAQDIWR